ncbi:TPA: 3-hydroxyacyl-ACP dehydratase FabZ [Candidatus Bipolaricaulota bacterium]|nr:3-hydroxyacyl-ACP dehydratase FabZ [Candidatus Bipolaricaulota bacterium]
MGERGSESIKELIPNRYPLLLIDRILEEGEDRVKVLKNVTINEPFFVGHFPEEPVMPGTLILEGMAQAVGILVAKAKARENREGKVRLGYLVGVRRARFHKPVLPGDRLIYEARLTRARGNFYQAEVTATVEGERVAEALISLALVE